MFPYFIGIHFIFPFEPTLCTFCVCVFFLCFVFRFKIKHIYAFVMVCSSPSEIFVLMIFAFITLNLWKEQWMHWKKGKLF